MSPLVPSCCSPRCPVQLQACRPTRKLQATLHARPGVESDIHQVRCSLPSPRDLVHSRSRLVVAVEYTPRRWLAKLRSRQPLHAVRGAASADGMARLAFITDPAQTKGPKQIRIIDGAKLYQGRANERCGPYRASACEYTFPIVTQSCDARMAAGAVHPNWHHCSGRAER
jgi:hypothetical protein